MPNPLVIAHRGASAYRPENTLAAFELGIEQGADGIEFDLVTTRDERLIIRHENTLNATTDISTHNYLGSAKRFGVVENKEVVDFFTEDFTLDQIKTLRAIERLPDTRPGSAKFDRQFEIPTFAELLKADFLERKLVVAEIKQGSHLKSLTTPIQEIMAKELLSSPVANLVVESFDYEILLETKKRFLEMGITSQYFYLMEKASISKPGFHFVDIDGISISMEMLFSSSDWVGYAHENHKKVWVYTARAEEAETSIEEYYERIIQTGVDGIFADQPDLLRRVLDDSRGSTYDY